MNNFIENTEKKLFSFKSLEIINFGHIGDNNLHFNVCLNSNLSVKRKNQNYWKNKSNNFFKCRENLVVQLVLNTE